MRPIVFFISSIIDVGSSVDLGSLVRAIGLLLSRGSV